jgi:hypothetical protein
MRTYDEWCEFFQKIEKDPRAIVSGLRISDLLAARSHVQHCKECDAALDRVLANAPPKPLFDRENLN